MKRPINILLLILIARSCFSQEQTVFNYNYPLEWNYDCNLMLLNDDYYYIAGDVGRVTAECEYVLYGFHITKINNIGTRDTTVIFDKCGQTSYMAWNGSMHFNSGNIAMIGHEYNSPVFNRFFFMHIDTYLDTISNVVFMDDTITKRAFSFTFDQHENIVIAGSTDSTYNEMTGLPETTYSKSSLFKVKQNGGIIWQRSYSFGDISDGCWSTFHRVINTTDNGFIAIGRTSDFGNSMNLILKTDSVGNQEWVNFYGNGAFHNPGFSDIIATHDSCYVVCGAYTYGETFGGLYPYDGWLVKIDNDGNEKWNKKYRDYVINNTDWRDTITCTSVSIDELHDKGFACIALVKSSECLGKEFRIYRIDSVGNLLWTKLFTEFPECNNTYHPNTIKQTADSGFAISGWVEYYEWNGSTSQWDYSQRIFLIKTDSLGNDTILSDISPVQSKPITEFKLQCYPNPATDEFFVELPQWIDNDVLEIYSTNGSLVLQQTVG
ncbi:MAG TPA: hypothetical protein PLA77_01035, partial [Bacteroidales bacterium]|nr:hypothetical protein [Bacteroidales bacterium]